MGSRSTSKRTVGTIKRSKGELRVLSRKRFWTVRTPQPSLLVKRSSCSLVNRVVETSPAMSTWVVDLGVSFHLTPKRECFASYTARDYGYVKMGNDGACKIVRIGDICLLASMGYIKMGNDG